MVALKHIRKKEQYTTTLTSIQSQQTAKMQTPQSDKIQTGVFFKFTSSESVTQSDTLTCCYEYYFIVTIVAPKPYSRNEAS